MREGLRSGALLAKLDNDEDDLEKGDDEINCHNLGNEENGPESDVEERAALILGDLNVDEVSMGSSPGKSMEGSVEGDKNGSTGRKRSRRDDNECDVGDCVERKKVKEDTVDGSGSNGFKRKEANDEFLDGNVVVVLGRVLRSRSAAMGGKEKEINGNEVRDGPERSASAKEVQIRDRGNDQSENKVVRLDESESKESVGQGNKKLKRKRGRPPKIQEKSGASKAMGDEEEVASVGQGKKKLKRKRGRPPKIREKSGASKAMGDEEEVASVGQGKQKLKRKRGRPPKIQEKSGASDAMSDEEEKVSGFNKRRRGSKLVDSVNQEPMEISCLGKEFIPKELNSKRISSAKENKSGGPGTQNKETSARVRSEQLGAFSPKTKNKKMKIKGNKTKECNVIPTKQQLTEKHLIRQQVTDLLLRCGWTIDYRPRRGREYNDAVYMSPDGRGYWSVTLAYKVLKKQAEEADGDSKHSSTSSAFIPIPEDDINKLTRITKKKMERELKLKKKTGGAIESDEVITDKKSTKKHCNAENSSSVSHGDKQNSDIKLKRQLGRKKGKLLHQEQAISNGTPSRGMKISVRTRKLQKTDIRARCALLVRNSKDGQNSESDDYALYPWKRSVLTWMIDLETLPLNGKVLCMNRRKTQVKLEGRIVRDGIQCGCCDEIFTISKFDAHSGSKLFQPLQNIYLESGTSLLECQLDSWNKQKESERNGFHYIDVDGDDPNDDTCGICGDGGDLICCDSCPSTFHQSCLDIQKFPSGDWHCVYCLCKLCGMVDGNMNQKDDCHTVTSSELFTCHLCEEKYHHSCSQAQVPGADDSIASSFCGDKCGELFERLEMLLGIKHQLEEGFSWTLIKRSDVASDLLLSGMPHKIESNSKLAVALAVMDECFLPVIDHRSGINVIHNILYNCGSNFNRLNYSGFFTAILERGDEIISAASIRIHGNQLAEMPFIGTRHMYRRQGMCSRLLSAIESALRSLNVEKLVIPAISELSQTWTSVFGFKPLEVSKRKEMRNLNMLVFPGTDLLQKPLLEHQSSVENGRPAADLESADLGKENQTGISPLPADDTRGGNEPYSTKEINENQKAGPTSTISTPDRTAVEQKSEQNQRGSCVESESLILSHNESMVSTETVSCEVKRGIVKNDASHDERSIYCADDAVTELQNVVEPPSQASCENTDCHNSEASNHIPHNGNGHESPQLKVWGFGLDADDKAIASQVINPTFLADDQGAQAVVNDSVVALADECDLNPSSQIGNLNNCERAEPAPAKANCLLPYEASNGTAEPDLHTSVLPCSDGVNHHMAQEVSTDDVHDLKVGPIASQTSSSFAGDFLPDGNQRVSRSSKHSLSDSQVDHTSTAQCNSASLCNLASAPGVALLCAPGACNACGNPEVIILSNQAG